MFPMESATLEQLMKKGLQMRRNTGPQGRIKSGGDLQLLNNSGGGNDLTNIDSSDNAINRTLRKTTSGTNLIQNRANKIRQKHANAQELKTRMRNYRRLSSVETEGGNVLNDDAAAIKASLQTLEDVLKATNDYNTNVGGPRRAKSLTALAGNITSNTNSNSINYPSTTSATANADGSLKM
jgi:hypothetical protein